MRSQRHRCHYRPFIEDVDDRLPDLIQEGDSCQKYPLDSETFSDTGLHLNAIPASDSESVTRLAQYGG